jgi:hypothetical protein
MMTITVSMITVRSAVREAVRLACGGQRGDRRHEGVKAAKASLLAGP